MTMLHEPGTQRFFASDMNGKLYAISSDGKTVTPFLDLTSADWKVGVQAQGSERGFQSFAFHPQFNQRGARGFGKFYTVSRFLQHDRSRGLQAEWRQSLLTIRSCSNGPRRTPQPQPMTALRRGN